VNDGRKEVTRLAAYSYHLGLSPLQFHFSQGIRLASVVLLSKPSVMQPLSVCAASLCPESDGSSPVYINDRFS
jgi:hypothetical protein